MEEEEMRGKERWGEIRVYGVRFVVCSERTETVLTFQAF